MWFGTSQGLNRYDGYQFQEFSPIAGDTTSLKGLLVRSIVEDKNGTLWVGTENGGLNQFDRNKETFLHFLKGKSVNKLLLTADNWLWVATTSGLYHFNIKTHQVEGYFEGPNSISQNIVRCLAFDKKGQLWIGTYAGIDIYNPQTKTFRHFKKIYNGTAEDEIQTLFADAEGRMWIGSFNSGFFVYDPDKDKLEQFIPDQNYERCLSVRSILRDSEGIYWIGTRGGLYLFDYDAKRFSFFAHSDRELASLANNSILDIAFDKKGDIWLSTRGGISYVASEKQFFKHEKALFDDNRHLNDNEIFAFWLDKFNNLWIGTENGGVNIYNTKTGTYKYLKGKKDNLTVNTIKTFADDGRGNVWVGTFLGGINVVDIASQRVVKHFMHSDNDPNTISDNKVWSIARDVNGNMWIGTDKGLDCYYAATGKIVRYRNISQDKAIFWITVDKDNDLWVSTSRKLLIMNPVTRQFKTFEVFGREMFYDSKGRYWLTTFYKGLYLFDKQKGPIKNYTDKNGLPNSNVLSVLEDHSGMLWISTTNGLSRFDPEKEIFKNYEKRDGLQNNQFYYGARIKMPNGDLLFGGVNGYNSFNPAKAVESSFEPQLHFTGFKIFNQQVAIDGDILPKAISESDYISIPYRLNMFTLEFTALNFAQSHKTRYRYKMAGFDKEWIVSGANHSAIYTNLNPGKYTFYVEATIDGVRWSSKPLVLKVQILPPFYKTWWFKVLVILFILGVIYLLIKYLNIQNKIKHELSFERMRARQIHELDLMKVKFFTNISHEIRTPLTLIIGPVEEMMGKKLDEKTQASNLEIIYRNAQQLLKLVNQLLDFRKLESGNLKLELQKGNIVEFIGGQVEAFRYMANDKGIVLKFQAVDKQMFTFFDSDKVEKIMNNLLSNAMKFTNRGGTVTVNISLIIEEGEDVNQDTENRFVEIVVKDTGVGIPESNVEKVFLRFFQSKNSENQTGTGIGLAFTRELVKLHKGRISVESKPDKGTRFVILLPFIDKDIEQHTPVVASRSEDVPETDSELESHEEEEDLSQKIILVIEDNPDVRFFVRSHFEPEYKVMEAPDGKEGMAQAFKVIPDVIISDIMMPGCDGIELCRKLKKDERTSHIPIVLLTALTSKENTLQGLSAGADDYITKPFDIAILHSKVENLLMLRRSMQIKYSGETILQPRNITLSSPDDRFLKKAIEIVEKFIEDPDFDSDKFANEIGVSRMQLYRKMNALTDMTVREFIRNIRLKRAAQLIVQNKVNISEVAYMVGFKELSHFRKCFRQEFGMSASEYAEKFKELSQ
jgi:ligand-binding sensor domain-containing protein/signal transduction histidine kinase/DNA-binding response OmpR family regulator